MAERLKAHAWKVCMRETVSRVRIPPPPPNAHARIRGVAKPDFEILVLYLRRDL